MLVLTRRLNEAVRIGDAITVRVLDIGDGTIRLGIEAPREIPVHREEIFLQIQQANRTAAAALPNAVAEAARRLGQPSKAAVTRSAR